MLDLRHLTTGLCLLNRRLVKDGLAVMTLRDFIQNYHEELEDYYDEDFGSGERILDDKYGSTVVFCLVDTRITREGGFSEFIPRHIKKKLRRAGKWRRDKLKHQWSYVNPMNRVQGYIVVKDLTNIHRTTKTLSLSCICSTSYTERRGIGGELMRVLKKYAEDAGYKDIILEVANEFSAQGMSDEFWAEKEGNNEEEEEDEEENEGAEEGEEEGEEEEQWYPDEDALEVLSYELWRKCMRKNERGIPYYNLEQEYIEECVREYLLEETTCEESEELWEGNGLREVCEDEPGENDYGGFWYLKGKRSQIGLMEFYEKWGFKEDPDVHLKWGCYEEIPFPTMRLNLF
jgi:ribosomal protein S18 acetylase RimI-like enzyme